MSAASNAVALDSIIFPEASKSISLFHRQEARSRLAITSRLRSIAHDADFVSRVAAHYKLPIVANERCGSWYVSPSNKRESVYFKSTDGHFGQWSFSLRRLNLHLLDLIQEDGGCVIVDSTRRGKSMPDALSKTVPIWIAVLNRLLFPQQEASHALRTPNQVVSASEHAQIEAKLGMLLQSVGTLGLDLPGLKAKLDKPLQPLWMTQVIDDPAVDETLGYPVILCTASGRDVQIDGRDFDYVQGAADDAEAWAEGLTPALFWSHRDMLMQCSEDELPGLIARLVADEGAGTHVSHSEVVKHAPFLSIGTIGCGINDLDALILCSPNPDIEHNPAHVKILKLKCPPGKLGSRALRPLLPSTVPFLDQIISMSPAPKILIVCPTGKDHSVGVALAVLCLYASDAGEFVTGNTRLALSKNVIKKRLSWITISIPDANPSRATLQSVNAFLLGDAG